MEQRRESGRRGQEDPIVFVVDDDASVRRALRRLIQSVGLSVQVFATATDFLACRRRSRRPECLILDIRLPDMSGIELQKRLQKMKQQLPIVFITGHETEEARESALASGAIELLDKPFDEHSLLNAIWRALDDSSRVFLHPEQ